MSNENVGQEHIPVIGKRLFRLALEWSLVAGLPGTQKDRETAIKATRGRKKVVNGSRSVRVAREATEAAAEAIRRSRIARDDRRIVGRIGHAPVGITNRRRGRKPVRLPEGRLTDRLDDMRKNGGWPFVREYRYDRLPEIVLTDDPAQVGVSQSEHLDWDYYSRSTKWPKKIVETTIFLPRDWRVRVMHRGLGWVDGLTTLDAVRMEGVPEGVAVYAATWLEQGRGYDLRSARGFIALASVDDERVSYHASTAEKALAGVRRKLGLRKADAALVDLLGRYGLEGIVERHPDLRMTVQDARSIGACDPGIRSWCHRTGLDYEAGQATLQEVYAAYRRVPVPDARAAILRALRRHKVDLRQDAEAA